MQVEQGEEEVRCSSQPARYLSPTGVLGPAADEGLGGSLQDDAHGLEHKKGDWRPGAGGARDRG